MSVVLALFREYWPLLVVFVLGLVLGSRGCGELPTQTVTIEKPIPTVRYVDRWKTDTVRFVSREVSVKFDTITLHRIESRSDTLILPDTVRIVEAWLTEQLNYDTIAKFDGQTVRLSWSNYQNRTENLQIDLASKVKKFGIGAYVRGGVQTDYKSNYSPVIGGGILMNQGRFIFGPDYSYANEHQITLLLGYQL